MALLVAGGAAGVLPLSLSWPLPLRRTHPPTLVCCFSVFAAMGLTSTKSGRLEVNLSLTGWKRGGRATWEQFYFQLFQESGDFAWSSVSLIDNLYLMGFDSLGNQLTTCEHSKRYP